MDGRSIAAELVYRGLGEERWCKSGGISGNFGGAGSDLGPLWAVCMQIVSQAGWGMISAVFLNQKGDSGLLTISA
jgi:hypothetical protein